MKGGQKALIKNAGLLENYNNDQNNQFQLIP